MTTTGTTVDTMNTLDGWMKIGGLQLESDFSLALVWHHVTGTFGAHWEMDGVAIAQPKTPLMFISASTLRDLLNEVGRMIDELS